MNDDGGRRNVSRVRPRLSSDTDAGTSDDFVEEGFLEELGEGGDRKIQRRPTKKAIEGLNPEDIQNKSGNYLFTFGYPGSGKTTFQWFLMRYLMMEGNFRTQVDIPKTAGGEDDWEARRILNEWKTQWVEQTFPESTGAFDSDIREITIESRPLEGEKTPCRFSFLEMSGELLRMVKPEKNQAPKLSKLINSYLSNEKIKFIVVLMLHPEHEENDNLFASFLSYLDRIHPGIRSRMSLAIIVVNPEKSMEKLRQFGDAEGRKNYMEINDAALHTYVDAFAGESYQALTDWPDKKRTLLTCLEIGEIKRERGEQILEDPDFGDIEEIYRWIYNQFTGKRLGPTLLQRIFGAVSGWK